MKAGSERDRAEVALAALPLQDLEALPELGQQRAAGDRDIQAAEARDGVDQLPVGQPAEDRRKLKQ